MNVVVSGMPFSRAEISVNGLNVDPACILSYVARFSGSVRKSGPPYSASTAPVFGSIVVTEARISGSGTTPFSPSS